MRQAGYKALMETRIVQKILVANAKERDHLINLTVNDRLMFKINLRNRRKEVELCQFRIKSS
jgi:hypothetical protein